MGKHKTGALTTNEILRIELSYLIKKKFIQKGKNIQFVLSWTNNSNISVISNYISNDIWLRLIYTITDYNGKKYDYDYKIYLTERPSNLGIGNILYFICPDSNKLCRILYSCYGSHIWKARESYQNRIYYSGQTSSKLNYFNDRYWQIERTLEKLRQEKKCYYYKNTKTRRLMKIERLEQQKMRFDDLRWTIGVPKRLRPHFCDAYF
jgi:hypothetical protein